MNASFAKIQSSFFSPIMATHRKRERSEEAAVRVHFAVPSLVCLREEFRVPAMISWPGTIVEGESRHQLATGCDWLPTIADLTGASLPQHKLDGKSLKAVIDSPQAISPHSDFYWQIGKSWAVREGDWKLLGNPRDTSLQGQLTKDDQLFLVDLSKDMSEKHNLAASSPKKVEHLKRIYDRYQKSLSE